MHIEKNVFDNLIYTMLDDKKKSKDNMSARKDLRELGIRPNLWPDDNEKYQTACFSLNNQAKDTFLSVFQNVNSRMVMLLIYQVVLMSMVKSYQA